MDRFAVIAAITRNVFVEAGRNRLFVIMLAGLAGIMSLCGFVGALAITETVQVQAGVAAFVLRLGAVFITGLYVITCMVRELREKSMELVLTLPVPRYVYYAGKLCGCVLLAAVIAVTAGLPLLLYAGPGQAGLWIFSLFCELSIITALCLFLLFTLGQVTAAFSAVAAFYLLARSMGSMQLINHSPLLESHTAGREISGVVLDVMALLLPDFDAYTQSGWLVYGSGTVHDLWYVVMQTLVYVGLLSAAALFDLLRRDF